MADHSSDLAPVNQDDFMADRQRFADGVWSATQITTAGIIVLLVLMVIFLV